MAQTALTTNNREQSMRAIAVRHSIDLAELRAASWYVGRNVSRLNTTVEGGLAAIEYEQSRTRSEIEAMRTQLGLLTDITIAGFTAMINRLDQVGDQLTQIAQILRYPNRTQAAEHREQGIYLAGKRKILLAIEAFKQALAYDKTDFLSYFTLGYLYATNKQFDTAAYSFTECADFADKNQAIRAEAAILAAHCYSELEQTGASWTVVHQALSSHCPDLALFLVQYAATKSQRDFSLAQLINSFVIDAELMIAAEEMGLEHVTEAAQMAVKIVGKQNEQLSTAWKQLYALGKRTSTVQARTTPRSPKLTGNPHTDLANLVIYRRRLQMSVENMRTELADRAKTGFNEYIVRPIKPEWKTGALIRSLIGFGIIALVPDGIAHGDIPGTIILIVLGLGLLLFDNAYWTNYFFGWRDYSRAQQDYRLQQLRQNHDRELLETHRADIEAALESSKATLIATIPPAVPRAFTGDLIAYTNR